MATKDFIGYQQLIENAFRGVVRDALSHAARAARGERGAVMGSHHFNIIFDTRAPGVWIPDNLRERFPEAMKIVLQNQYWDLKVTETEFEVTLSFNKIPTQITVPFASLLYFDDPSQKLELRFQVREPAPAKGGALLVKEDAPPPAKVEPPVKSADAPPPAAEMPTPSGDTIVSLDKFRKK